MRKRTALPSEKVGLFSVFFFELIYTQTPFYFSFQRPKPVADSAAEYTEPNVNNASRPGDGPNDVEMDSTVEADRLKERGNELFKAKRYGEAIDLYTRAIGKVIIYYKFNHSF